MADEPQADAKGYSVGDAVRLPGGWAVVRRGGVEVRSDDGTSCAVETGLLGAVTGLAAAQLSDGEGSGGARWVLAACDGARLATVRVAVGSGVRLSLSRGVTVDVPACKVAVSAAGACVITAEEEAVLVSFATVDWTSPLSEGSLVATPVPRYKTFKATHCCVCEGVAVVAYARKVLRCVGFTEQASFHDVHLSEGFKLADFSALPAGPGGAAAIAGVASCPVKMRPPSPPPAVEADLTLSEAPLMSVSDLLSGASAHALNGSAAGPSSMLCLPLATPPVAVQQAEYRTAPLNAITGGKTYSATSLPVEVTSVRHHEAEVFAFHVGLSVPPPPAQAPVVARFQHAGTATAAALRCGGSSSVGGAADGAGSLRLVCAAGPVVRVFSAAPEAAAAAAGAGFGPAEEVESVPVDGEEDVMGVCGGGDGDGGVRVLFGKRCRDDEGGGGGGVFFFEKRKVNYSELRSAAVVQPRRLPDAAPQQQTGAAAGFDGEELVARLSQSLLASFDTLLTERLAPIERRLSAIEGAVQRALPSPGLQ
eukprot:Rhum_TRINITY_DN13614_c1_g1::Rhum_TRINITY_DN13614_c1_g1_i1::g.61978::m.61978